MHAKRAIALTGLATGVVLACAAAALADAAPVRPDTSAVERLATCELQPLAARPTAPVAMPALSPCVARPVADDPLANYQRTPLGDWPMPQTVDRDDPWLRLLLLGPRQPLVIDVAVYVDGRPYAHGREAWIDEVLGAAPPDAVADAVPHKSADSADTADATDTPKVVETPTVATVSAQVRHAPTMHERLLRYVATVGPNVDRKEIYWLIAEWGSGPAVVVLDPSVSWQRARLAPLWAYLDRDRDGTLGAAEIAGADAWLHHADVDRNDVVEESELHRAATALPVLPMATGHSLTVLVDDATDWEAFAADVARIYGASGMAGATAEQLRPRAGQEADATLRVDFRTADRPATGLSLVALGPQFAARPDAVFATSNAISMDTGVDFLEFSAAQGAQVNRGDVATTQVAIGAVIDGNPLLRLVDRDQDHRITLRERQQLAGLLTALDRNGDGRVDGDELPLPIRFAVTLGPHVHELLATPTGAARAIAPRDLPTPPSWFTSMDKNGDRDVSGNEFLGTFEEFRRFDADGDGLLSVAEALQLDAGQ